MGTSVKIEDLLEKSDDYDKEYVDLINVLCKKVVEESEKQQKAIIKDKDGEEIFMVNNCDKSKAQNKRLKDASKYDMYRCQVRVGRDDVFLLTRSQTKIVEK